MIGIKPSEHADRACVHLLFFLALPGRDKIRCRNWRSNILKNYSQHPSSGPIVFTRSSSVVNLSLPLFWLMQGLPGILIGKDKTNLFKIFMIEIF